MSFEYYLFIVSNKIFKIAYFVDSYIPFIFFFKKIYNYFQKKKEKVDEENSNNNIEIKNIYYIYESNYKNKNLIMGLNDNINLFWDTYEKEFKHKPNKNDAIEVHYTIPHKVNDNKYIHKPFIISYSYPSVINFPPYTEEEIKNKEKKEILFASLGNDDVTDQVNELAGPLGNFYTDLPKEQNIYMIKNLLEHKNLSDKLIITDVMGDEYNFSNYEKILF